VLARSGLDVVGLDISAHHIELARSAAKDNGVRAEFIVGDMREPPPGPFDAVINMFTAFGYLETDDEDALVIERAAARLQPGGRFLIDFHTILRTLRHWQPTGVERGPDGTLLVDEREYDVLGGRLHSHWTSIGPDGSRHESDIHPRVYTPAELRRMFDRAGMRVMASYGDFDASPLTPDSRRVILVATKD
jgi:SAM-dependent methyltransferase